MDIKLSNLIDDLFKNGNLISLTASDKRKKSSELKKVTMRPVIIQEELLYQLESFRGNQAFHENLNPQDACNRLKQLIEESFKQLNIFAEDHDYSILASKPERARIKKKEPSKKLPQCLCHNREKEYIIPDGIPCDFLVHLGVMTKEGKVKQKHYSKFRQINRYLEIVDDVFEYLPKDRTIKIIDFGCGKAYLTFALYHYLKKIKGLDVDITGLDLKKSVINFCNKVAEELNYAGLRFLHGDIADYKDSEVDMVVTLHACDTATDYALINAVEWSSKIILSVPCCQHQLFKQIENDIHQPMLKHGILKDRLTEYLTDGLRGLKLESKGYDVSMIEFTSLEHTSKNIMIKAVKARSSKSPAALRASKEYEILKDFYHVDPEIDRL